MRSPPPMFSTNDTSTILLIDDSPEALVLLSLELHQAGFHVHTASSGEAALIYLEDHLPDAILLDVMMPGMDGFETCRRIRTRHLHLPVIFMTGLGETEHILRGFEVGGNDYVTKPIAPPVVVARLHAHTRVAALVRATREAINASELAMLVVDSNDLLAWCNAAARSLLEQLALVLVAEEGQALPPLLVALRNTDVAEHRLTLPGGTLLAHRVTENAQALTVYTLHRSEPDTPGRRALPKLTNREGEVLLWVARGKTNRDIADILGMSPRTVAKHMEHIFEKLGVETRTAAAGAARHFQPPNKN